MEDLYEQEFCKKSIYFFNYDKLKGSFVDDHLLNNWMVKKEKRLAIKYLNKYKRINPEYYRVCNIKTFDKAKDQIKS